MSDQAEMSYASWILKSAGVSIAFAYSLGFLVVARHLSRYGASTFSMLHIQYLVAGIWAMTPPVSYALVQRTVNRFSDKAWLLTPPRRPKPKMRVSWLAIPAMGGIPFALSLYVWYSLLGTAKGFILPAFSRIYVSYMLLAYAADMAWMSWRVPEGTARWWLNRHAVPYYVTVFAFGILVWALTFADWIYPTIPYSLGGGRPQTIVFIPGDKQLPVGILKDNSFGRSVPYKLVTTTDKSYIVISPNPNEESIELNRDSVQGIIVLKEPHPP